jgi:hypothetical protein
MIPQAIQNGESALRRAVEQRRFPLIDSLASSYCRLADAHLSTLPPGCAARLDLLTRVIAVLKWTHLMVSTARAGYAERLGRLLLTKRYFAPLGAGEPALRLDV